MGADAALPPLERETLQAQILTRLEEQFLTGALAPGTKLTLRSLAASMGTSLMPVRDALQHLQSIGALEALPNRSLIVPVFSPAALRDLLEIRFRLEGFAVEQVARRGGRERMRRLARALAALEGARRNGGEAAYRRAHWGFHLAIVQESGVGALENLVRALWLQIGPHVKIGAGDARAIEEANAYHRAIFEALEAGDEARARQALEADIFYGLGPD